MLRMLACLDSAEMAEARRRELDMPRNVATALGLSALAAVMEGHYIDRLNRRVDWSREVQAARKAKVSIRPDAPLPSPDSTPFPETRVQVTNETTLGASWRLSEAGMRPLALNFANGVCPGGGFLTGARAQEEVLCRSSALSETLLGDEMYAEHLRRPRPDSTDWAILSPGVPVFRKDDGRELEQPWRLSFITCAAPYAPAIGQPESGDLLQQRILRVLAVARAYGYSAVVLGAWGCGAFRNDVRRTAIDFRRSLDEDFSGAFAEVVFAITDWSPDRRFLGPFRNVLSEDWSESS